MFSHDRRRLRPRRHPAKPVVLSKRPQVFPIEGWLNLSPSIDDLEREARAAARRGDQKTLSALLLQLDAMTPLGGRHDRFAHFCNDLERMTDDDPDL